VLLLLDLLLLLQLDLLLLLGLREVLWRAHHLLLRLLMVSIVRILSANVLLGRDVALLLRNVKEALTSARDLF